MSNKNNGNPSNGSDPKTRQVMTQIEEVKDIMHGNVVQLMGNMDNLQLVEEKSNDLRERSRQFNDGAGKLKRAMWWKNVKSIIIIGAIAIVIIGAIVLIIAISI